MAANADSMTAATMDAYLNALEKLFVIEDIDAWRPAIRSATTIRSGKKRGFTDPSIPVAAMGLTPSYFHTDLKTFGFIFECLCIRDLKVYSQAMGGKVSYKPDFSVAGSANDCKMYFLNEKKYKVRTNI